MSITNVIESMQRVITAQQSEINKLTQRIDGLDFHQNQDTQEQSAPEPVKEINPFMHLPEMQSECDKLFLEDRVRATALMSEALKASQKNRF